MSKTTNPKNTKIDLVVIGGGPAGMMSAGRGAERGLRVVLLEKNASLGKKLLITGGGRCNVTNNKPDVRTMLSKYKHDKQFLFSAFSQFAVEETLEFFERHGMQMKEENEGRMFPVSNKAQTVWDVMNGYIQNKNITIQTRAGVKEVSVDSDTKNIIVHLADKTQIMAKSCIIATGGTSHPETGSTGDGFTWLRKLGHTVVENNFALVPIALKDAWVKKLGGVTLDDIKLTVFQNNKKQESQIGKLLFTHFGISGPTVLNMSRNIGELVQYGEVTIALDLFPKLDHKALKQTLHLLLTNESNKKLKNTLSKLIPSSIVPSILALIDSDGETPNHSVRSEQRKALVLLLKHIPLHVKGLLSADKAVVSSGGVSLKEVDFKTMESRIIPNLYLVGDILNIDRPSGGYSLQLCWTTGYVAGSHVKEM